MDAGELTEHLSIRAQAAGTDAMGQPSGAWTEVGTEWASMRQQNGLETIRANAVDAPIVASFRIRWRTGYSTAMRVLHNGVTYEIKSINPDRLNREHVDLVCQAVLG